MFIIKTDLYAQIKTEELDILLESSGNPDAELATSIAATESQVSAYLRHKYDVAVIHSDVHLWAKASTYSTADLVYLWAPEHVATKTYQSGDLVNSTANGNRVYVSTVANNTAAPGGTGWDYVGSNASWYSSRTNGNTAYPSLSLSWNADEVDPRDDLIKRQHVDLILYDLHSRIKARQIPEHRIARRDDAIKFLQDVSDPRKNITLDLALKVHAKNTGNDMSFGNPDTSKFDY